MDADSFSTELTELMLLDPTNVVYESAYTFLGDDRIKPLLDFQEMIPAHLGFGLQKDSEFKALFDHHFVRLKQSGLLHQLHRKWLEGDAPADISGRIFTQDAFPLGYDNLFFPSFVIAMGVAAAAVMLLAERAANLCFNSKKEKAKKMMFRRRIKRRRNKNGLNKAYSKLNRYRYKANYIKSKTSFVLSKKGFLEK